MDKKDAVKRSSELNLAINTIGFLMEEIYDRYVLCQSYSHPEDPFSQSVDGVLIIPKTSVVETHKMGIQEDQ